MRAISHASSSSTLFDLRRVFFLAATLSASVLPLSCSDPPSSASLSSARAEDSGTAASAPGTLDDGAIEALATTYAGFARVNRDAYPTRQHQGNPLVNVFANDVAASTYESLAYGVSPDASVAFPPGSMLVKAMLDSSGSVDVLTVMYKKTAGYASSGGDWWYGRLGPDGVPTNPAYTGQVDFCVGCHAGAAPSDHAFGVSADNR
jgi:hypothetical protein